jgi:NDP-4-keto-2,6-dideoxyhexose 3-C-methyltransferase
MLYEEIKKCRICGNKNLVQIVDLGLQALTGVFPKSQDKVESGPLELVKCTGEDSCDLVQLKHNYKLSKMYGENYGYRSGLNKSMVAHLRSIVKKVVKKVSLDDNDLVIDIASNDGTLLSAYQNKKLDLLGVDPTAEKFKKYYPSHVKYISNFFSASIVESLKNNKKAKIITSISMFYDLPAPLETMKDIEYLLSSDGVWIVEQSYLPSMINKTSYDTICHEHLEYYSLKQFVWMAKIAKLKIIDLEFNDINGGSFSIMFSKIDSKYKEASGKIKEIIEQENINGFYGLEIYFDFSNRVAKHKIDLIEFLDNAKNMGLKVLGYGASTKGNVLLQYCGISTNYISHIADVNEYKYSRFTPGTNIPIISENESKKMKPDYYMVLPWHFREVIIERESDFLEGGGKLLFPLPSIELL